MAVSQRHSPAVRYTLQRSRVLRWTWLLAAAAGCVVLLAWAWLGAGYGYAWGWRVGIAAVLWVMCTGCGWQALQRQPAGSLHWNGHLWVWQSETHALELQGAPRIVLDVQGLLVLSFSSGPRFVLERTWAPQVWAEVRRAVYSSAHPTQDASTQQAH